MVNLLTSKETIVRPTVEDILSGAVENPKSILIQTSIAGGKERAGVTLTSKWIVRSKSKKVFFLDGLAETRFSQVPIESHDITDRHLREVRRVACAIFGLKRFDGIELFDIFHGDNLFWIESKEQVFMEERDAVLWCVLEKKNELIEHIQTYPLKIEMVFSSEEQRKVIRDAQKNSARLWTRIHHLVLQVESGINAINSLNTIHGRGINSFDLDRLWGISRETEEIPVTLKKIFSDE